MRPIFARTSRSRAIPHAAERDEDTTGGRSMRMLMAALALIAGAGGAGAADYTCSQLRLVVPYPAGGATDVATRVVAERLDAALKRPVVVENRGGATGNIGTAVVIASPPDGCT